MEVKVGVVEWTNALTEAECWGIIIDDDFRHFDEEDAGMQHYHGEDVGCSEPLR